MGQVIPRQYPAVVLRSHYSQLRALLAIALAVVAGLSVALVIVATDDESITTASSATQAQPVDYVRGGFIDTPDVATPNVATPDESKLAAAISRTQLAIGTPEVAIPDESKHAVAVSGAQQARDQSRPDESSVAAAIAR